MGVQGCMSSKGTARFRDMGVWHEGEKKVWYNSGKGAQVEQKSAEGVG